MSPKIKHSELIEAIAQDTELNTDFIRQFISDFGEIIQQGLMRDGKVRIHDFGTFSLHWINTQMGRNPQSGEPIEIPAHYRVLFHPTKSLKKAVNWRFAHLKPVMLGEKKATKLLPTEPDLEDLETEPPAPPKIVPAPEPTTIPVPPRVPEDTTPITEKKQPANKNRRLIFASIILFLLAFLIILVCLQIRDQNLPVKSEEVAQNDQSENMEDKQPTPETQPTKPSEAVDEEHSEIPPDEADTQTLAATPSTEPAEEVAEDKTISQPPEKTEPVEQPSTEKTPKAEISEQKKSMVYRTSTGDNLWDIATRYYERPYWWPIIYHANMTDMNNPDVIGIGVDLNVPRMQGTGEQPTVDDKREAALGYFNASLAYKKIGRTDAFNYLQQAILLDSTLMETRRQEISEEDYQRLKTMEK